MSSIVLVTGFEPYGKTPVNPAEGVARALDGEAVGDARIVGRVVPLPLLEVCRDGDGGDQ